MNKTTASPPKKRVAIFGPTGMIGSALYASLKDSFDLVLVVRDSQKLKTLDERYGDVASHTSLVFDTGALRQEFEASFSTVVAPTLATLFKQMGEIDAAINCMGVINKYNKERSSEMLFINSMLPHALSAQLGERLIQVTTDCVFDGKAGAPYDEDALARPRDLYGITKRAGEPGAQSLVLRTSMIGPELSGSAGLLEWVCTQKGNTISGYRNALWNGITTFEFARICWNIIEHRDAFPCTGIYHLFSTDVSKYDMVKKIAAKYNVQTTLVPDEQVQIDRRLATRFDVCGALNIPSFDEMLAALP